ncbi:hypothetical protein V6N13_046217 [Hibiscus sabdariffa]
MTARRCVLTPVFLNVFFTSKKTATTISRNLEWGSCIHAAVLKSRLQTDVFVNNSLLHMYMKCGCIEHARKLFDHMPERTVASWTAMISGYCNNGLADEGLTTFVQMLENEYPNEFTLAAALQIVAENCNSRFTCILHGYIIKGGFLEDSFLQNSLISAYAKSGILSEAVKLLERCCFLDFCYFRFCVTWIRARSGYGFLQDARRWGCTQRGDNFERFTCMFLHWTTKDIAMGSWLGFKIGVVST